LFITDTDITSLGIRKTKLEIMIKRLLEQLGLIKPQKPKLVISDVIISTDKLTEYQLEIRTRLREKFNDLQIEIGRGDRLMINGVVITGGVRIDDIRNRKDYENDIKFFSDEIKRQYLDKRKY